MSRLLAFSLAGTVITALCCFTLLLVIALTAIGAGSAIVWLDAVLLPLLAAFIVLTGYALWLGRKRGTI